MEAESKDELDVRSIVRNAIEEFVAAERTKAEPAYKAELLEERRRREQLEQRLNELAEENRQSRRMAEEAERNSAIRAELQRLGVSKLELAFRAIKDDIQRTEDGQLVAKDGRGETPLREYLSAFVNENPELLPARMAGGSGVGPASKAPPSGAGLDLDKIRPGMSPEELERARQEISRVASQTLHGS